MKAFQKSIKLFLLQLPLPRRNFFCAVWLILLPLFSLAQDPMLFIYRPHWPQQSNTFHNAISFSGEYNAGSDALTNSFINSFYKGA
ncbi:MAG TPA: hypothetical protein VFJ43_09975, partial [Bacteroidia bacterium]|nr:hypothetical protein [Bacteroidia bacterium]